MSPEKKEIISEWYQKAEEDILAAEAVIEASLYYMTFRPFIRSKREKNL